MKGIDVNKNKEQRKAEILAALRNEEVISISGIQKTFGIGFPTAAEIYKEEMARRKSRVELHLHTCMSAFSGFNQAHSFFEAASEKDVRAIAVTDLGSVQSYRAAEKAGKDFGVKPIFGAEFFLDSGEDVFHRVVVLAKNREGIKAVYELVTLSQTVFQKENIPFLPIQEITERHENILVGLVACDRGIASSLGKGFKTDVQNLFSSFDYIEIATPEVCTVLLQNDSVKYCQDFLRRIISIANHLGVPVIASDDACYVEAEEDIGAGALDYSRAIDPLRRKSIKEPIIKGRHFRSTKEMLDGFSFLGEEAAHDLVIDGPNRISAKIEKISLFEDKGGLIPLYDDADQRIEKICRERLEAVFPDGCPAKYSDRLEKELSSIKKTSSASVFLTTYLIAEKAKKDGKIQGNRGMAGNSLVTYLLGITEINPLKPACCDSGSFPSGGELPMEMAFGIEGDRVLDIDLEFSSDYLENTHDYLRALFGKENVVRAGTIEPLYRKSSVLRAQSYLEKQGIEFDSPAFEIAVDACMASKRHMGQHPCGYVVLPKGHDWNEFTPLEYPCGCAEFGHKITHYPWTDIIALGQLYKFDLLGNCSLDLLERLSAETGVDINNIRLDDQGLIDVLCGNSEETTCEMIPGYQGEIVREVISIAEPSTFLDLVKVKGILHGTGIWDYYKGKLIAGELSLSDEVVTNRDDLFSSLLSHGVKREFAYAIAEGVRKGRGLTKEMKETLETASLSKFFIEVCERVKYLFPKAHILSLLYRELRLAYFKLHFPKQYERIYRELFD